MEACYILTFSVHFVPRIKAWLGYTLCYLELSKIHLKRGSLLDLDLSVHFVPRSKRWLASTLCYLNLSEPGIHMMFCDYYGYKCTLKIYCKLTPFGSLWSQIPRVFNQTQTSYGHAEKSPRARKSFSIAHNSGPAGPLFGGFGPLFAYLSAYHNSEKCIAPERCIFLSCECS